MGKRESLYLLALTYKILISYSLWHDVLEPVSVLVFQSRHHDLPPLPPGGLQLEEGGGRGFPPLRQEDDEREGFEGVLKQALEVGDHAVHQLLTERRVGFKGTAQRLEVHYRSGTKRVVSHATFAKKQLTLNCIYRALSSIRLSLTPFRQSF